MNNRTHSSASGSGPVSPLALVLGAIGTACLAKGVSEFIKAGKEEASNRSGHDPEIKAETITESKQVKYKVLMHMPEGDFYDEGIYNTEEEAAEAALCKLSSYRTEAEILKNRGEAYGDPDEASYEIEEMKE